jgi:hypothetical protein
MKTCSACQMILLESDFYQRKGGRLESRCKKCFILAQAEGIKNRQEANIRRGDSLRRTKDYKICPTCVEAKLYVEFGRAKKNADGHTNQCLACSRPYAKKYYEANRERVRDSQTASLRQSISVKREYLIEYYRNHPCVDCGETNVLVLQSDHQYEKEHEIARLVNSGHALQTLIDELAKCQTRCANCHQIVTANAFGYWRLQYV